VVGVCTTQRNDQSCGDGILPSRWSCRGDRVTAYRVTSLHYRFESLRDTDRFEEAAPVSGKLGDFDYVLADGRFIATPRAAFRDREEARDALEAHLRDWEQGAFLSVYA
jgi:hypothetical protein